MTVITCGKRRFTCLTPRLVRLEFSPSGVFEDRPSLFAFTRPTPIPFDSVDERDGTLTLRAGEMTLISQQNDRDFFPTNLRIDFKLGDRTQTWRFGDRDYRNLGGAVRSLDYYGRDSLLEGVHPASTTSPDDFFHLDAELFETAQVYMQDGHFDWQLEIMRQGLHGALRYAPHMVYNRYRNMLGDLSRYQPGLLSRSGYFLLNDSTGTVLDKTGFPVERNTPGTRDLYFFGYGADYKTALADYRSLGGPIPLPAKNVFGIQFSRWPAFSEAEARALVGRFIQEGIPLSVLILDLEWHIPDFSHWDWNPETYPRPESFLQWAHSQNLQVALNVHPQNIFSTDSHFAPFIAAGEAHHKVKSIWENPIVAMTVKSGADRMISPDLADPREAAAMKTICCDPILRQGVDYWWLDGASAQCNGADGQLLSTKVFYETTTAGDRRGMVQARYGGLGSHRYGILFTGDTQSQWEVLQSECEFNIRAGQVGMAYVSHDIGGFSHSEAPIIDSDLYIRWLQFGVFNPVLRFHSAPGSGSRQPWDYGEKNLEIARRWLKVRHSFIPYIYAAARQAYETGLPLVRGLYLDYPDREDCYRFDQFLFGDSLLIAPVLTPSNHRLLVLPPGTWYEFETGAPIQGGAEIHVFADLAQVPVYVKAGAVLLRQGESVLPNQSFISDLLLDVYPGAAGEAVLYEDDGHTRAYQEDAFSQARFNLSQHEGSLILRAAVPQSPCFGEERRVRVQAALPASPRAVTWNGTPVPAEKITFEPGARRVTVDLGILPSSDGWELIITP